MNLAIALKTTIEEAATLVRNGNLDLEGIEFLQFSADKRYKFRFMDKYSTSDAQLCKDGSSRMSKIMEHVRLALVVGKFTIDEVPVTRFYVIKNNNNYDMKVW